MDGRQTAPLRPPNPALPHREDCWSEGESSVLIDAWGDRYVELNRGNLRQKQWQEVADAVNSRPCDARRPPRTDIQCKNRIDTLKKKHKAEKSRIAAAADSATSSWIFFDRLDYLIKKPTPTPTPTSTSRPPSSSSPPLALPLPSHFKNYPLPTATLVHPIPNPKTDSFYRKRSRSNSSSSSSSAMKKRARSRKVAGGDEEEEGDEFRELSEVIVRFGEIYEKVEMEKQRQTMELERGRAEFAKSVEVKRLEMFADMQVRLAKSVSERRGDDRRIKGRSSSSSSSSAAAAALSFLLQPVMF